jgi:hypothetical protein
LFRLPGFARWRKGDPAGALDAYTRALHIAERLAAADPDNTEFQRDVWVGNWKVASSLESLHDRTARDFWSRAHRILVALDASGRLPDGDRQFLDELTPELGPS